MKLRRNCYCDTWKTFGGRPITGEYPDGFCGVCQLCGEAGHRSAPPAVGMAAGVWCDRCFLIESHTARRHDTGAFYSKY